MVLVHLVRHARAASGWDRHPDPELDAVGVEQAERLALRLAPLGEPRPPVLLTSPLRRCRETAAPIGTTWAVTPAVEPAMGEIPSPVGVPMEDRVEWLRAAMAGTWPELGPRYLAFRDSVVAFVATRAADTLIVSHFVAINAVLGACLGDDRVVIRRLDNASVTVVEVDGAALTLVEGGHEADTLIR